MFRPIKTENVRFVGVVALDHVNFEELWDAEDHRNDDDGNDVVNDPTPRVHPLGGVVVLDGLGHGKTPEANKNEMERAG